MKTDYAGHDRAYQRRKAEGRVGWESAEVIASNIASLATALSAVYMPSRGVVLEIGCGAGDLSLWLAGRGFEVHGVDIAPSAIEWAREKARDRGLCVRFRVADVTGLIGYAPDAFDLVLDGYCLHCIIGSDRLEVLSNVLRVLRPGGIFHIRTMCNDPSPAACRENYDPTTRCQVHAGIASRYYGRPEDIESEVHAAGFQIVTSTVHRPDGDRAQDMLYLDARKPAG